jgi:hypothetical protein
MRRALLCISVVSDADPVVQWLLRSDEPAVTLLTRTDVLRQPTGAAAVRAARHRIPEGPKVSALLSGQEPDGGFGCHPYRKWTGAHWRLVSLVELSLAPRDPRALAAADQVLGWLLGASHRRSIRTIRGLVRRCASQEGNALAVCCRLGMAHDPRVRGIAADLIHWQWPDGGWNCDKRPGASHSSFNESLAPMWGLTEFWLSTGDEAALGGARRTAELFLRHRIFRSHRSGEIGDPAWLRLRYPSYWHYDVLQALVKLAQLGLLDDPRAGDALDLIETKRRPDGTWSADGAYWRRGSSGTGIEVVNWGRSGPNEMLTLNALRVLVATGRA